MDPITAAIVAIVTASATEIAKAGVVDAYNALKSSLTQKFGHQSKVVKAVQELEADPSSKARAEVLQEEITRVGADRDPNLLQIANYIQQQIRYYNQGDGNIFQSPGSNVRNNQRNRGVIAETHGGNIQIGRPGLVALVAIALVAIFAFLIWQIYPYLRNINITLTPTPTPIPNYARTPDEAVTGFCMLVKGGAADSAYKILYSTHLQQQVTPTEFENEWGFFKKPLSNCIGTIASSSTDQASGAIADTIEESGVNEVYKVTLIKEGKAWKIDSMQKQ